MLGLAGWYKTTSDAWTLQDHVTQDAVDFSKYTLRDANGPWTPEAGDVFTDDNGQSDTVMSVESSTVFYGLTGAAGWLDGFATVVRKTPTVTPHRVQFRGNARASDDTALKATTLALRSGSAIADTLASNTTSYAPTGWATADVVEVTPSSDLVAIETAHWHAWQQRKLIVNVHASNRMKLVHNSVAAGAYAEDKIITADAADLVLAPGDSAVMVRDTITATEDRWRVARNSPPTLPNIAGMVARWRSDVAYITADSGGDVSDHEDSALGHDLTGTTAKPNYNAVQIGGRPTVTYAAAETMSTPDATDLDMGQNTFLVAQVIKRPQTGVRSTQWGKGTHASGDNLRGYIDTSHRLVLAWGDDTESYANSTLVVPDDTACFVAWGIDAGSDEVVYMLNGTVERISVTLSGTGSNALAFYLHGDLPYDDDAPVVAETLVYKRSDGPSWTDAELQSIYNSYAQPYYSL